MATPVRAEVAEEGLGLGNDEQPEQFLISSTMSRVQHI